MKNIPTELIIIWLLIALLFGLAVAWYNLQWWVRRRLKIRRLRKLLPKQSSSGKYGSKIKHQATAEELEIIGEIIKLKNTPIFARPPAAAITATERQLEYIRILGGQPKPGMTMAEASAMIDELKIDRDVRRQEKVARRVAARMAKGGK